jgi:hypothetical protein
MDAHAGLVGGLQDTITRRTHDLSYSTPFFPPSPDAGIYLPPTSADGASTVPWTIFDNFQAIPGVHSGPYVNLLALQDTYDDSTKIWHAAKRI